MNSGVKVLQQETEKSTEKTLSQLIREEALAEFSKRKDDFGPNLAPILWYSNGVIAVLIQEIVSVYGSLSPPTLSSSNRVCHVLALLQPIASHPDTRPLFLNAHIPLFLYPFLNTVSKEVPFEYLRLTSLGVIGALVKTDDQEVIKFLLSTEIIPLCLRIMETGGELSQTVATFIVHKIISVDVGLGYTCATAERFYAVSSVLAHMVKESPTSRLLRHIIRCYLRLSDHPRAKETLMNSLPPSLADNTFDQLMNEDNGLKKLMLELRNTLIPQYSK